MTEKSGYMAMTHARFFQLHLKPLFGSESATTPSTSLKHLSKCVLHSSLVSTNGSAARPDPYP
jgi:hypothetical protein